MRACHTLSYKRSLFLYPWIHSLKASPFFILDEVDGALDNRNVEKVASFIRSRSCGGEEYGSGFQSIVISLKDNFYNKAEALVGVYRDSGSRGLEISSSLVVAIWDDSISNNDIILFRCSQTWTFDLTQYPDS